MTTNVSDWQKSSYCAQGEACIHVSDSPGAVALTESGDPAGSILHVDPAAWAALIRSIKDADNHG